MNRALAPHERRRETDDIVCVGAHRANGRAKGPQNMHTVVCGQQSAHEVTDSTRVVRPCCHYNVQVSTLSTTTPPLKLRFSATGTLNCFAVHFTLDLDGNPENCISSGRENLSSHWEQNARWLPVELAVRQGHELSLEASHSDHHLRTLRIPDVRREHVPANAVGHEHLIGMPIMQDAVVALDWAKR